MESFLYPALLFGIRVFNTVEKILVFAFYPLFKSKVHVVFRQSGILIGRNVQNPWDIQLSTKLSERAFIVDIVTKQAVLALGDFYVKGLIHIQDLEEFNYRLESSDALLQWCSRPVRRLLNYLTFEVFNIHTRGRSVQVMKKHYDMGTQYRLKS